MPYTQQIIESLYKGIDTICSVVTWKIPNIILDKIKSRHAVIVRTITSDNMPLSIETLNIKITSIGHRTMCKNVECKCGRKRFDKIANIENTHTYSIFCLRLDFIFKHAEKNIIPM